MCLKRCSGAEFASVEACSWLHILRKLNCYSGENGPLQFNNGLPFGLVQCLKNALHIDHGMRCILVYT